MNVLGKDELWHYMLRQEPTRKQRHRRFLWEGLIYYVAMCRRYPQRALGEIAGCAFIFGTMAVILYLPKIAAWIEGWAR